MVSLKQNSRDMRLNALDRHSELAPRRNIIANDRDCRQMRLWLTKPYCMPGGCTERMVVSIILEVVRKDAEQCEPKSHQFAGQFYQEAHLTDCDDVSAAYWLEKSVVQ